MKKTLILIAIAMLSLSGASALEPLKVAIMNTSSSAVNVQVILNDYTGGTATTKYTGAIQSLTPNGSGIIIAQVANNVGTDWDDITGAEVSSYYILDVLVGGNLYAQYRLDQLILSQSQSNIYNNNGNLAPSTSGGNDLGEDNNRWGELYVQGNTIHIGPDGGMAGADELAFSYNDATNTATMTVAGVTALTAVNSNIIIPEQATIDGLTIGQGGGNINTNTANGNNALFSNTTGSNNTANGQSALYYNTTGSNNTANGQSALRSNTTGSYNTANGQGALRSNTTGSFNTANGNYALFSNTTGSFNTANGQGALYYNTTGSSNTANGQGALFSNTTGSSNTANGQDALYSNTTGSSNTANGQGALFSNTTGSSNTANGNNALFSNIAGSSNTANGNNALFSNTTGSGNTANGATALYSNTSGSGNTANGATALYSNTSGSGNTAIGRLAGYNLASGSDNTFIGKEAGFNGSQKVDAQNSIAIGAGTYTTADNQVVIGNSAITETQLRGAKLVDLAGGGTQNLQVDNNGKIVVGGGSPFTHDAVNNIVYRNDPDDDFIFGDDDTQWSSGEESKLFFDKSKRAFRVGAVSSNNWDDANVGAYSFAAGYNSKAIGSNSIAVGGTALANSDAAVAFGLNPIANGSSSVALGAFTRANADNSASIGLYTIADESESTALGMYNDNTITGELLTVGNGSNTVARSNAFEVYKNGDVVVPALGGGGTQNLQVDNNGKIVVGGGSGAFTSASGVTKGNTLSDDLLFGTNTLNHVSGTESKLFFDNGNQAFRVGLISTTNWDLPSLGIASIGAGNNTLASGNYSVSMGYYTEATAEASVALGRFAKANGNYSVAIGNGGVADGTASVALGFNSNSNGDYSTTMGRETTADGNNSVAMGYQTTATAVSSVAMGYGTQSTAQYGLAAGKFNDPVSSHLFVVGNGTGVGSKSNAFAVLNSGNVEIGDDATATHTVKGTMNINDVLNANGSTGSVAVHFSATAPSSPVTGSLWYDSANSLLKIWDGSAWVNI